MHCRGPEETRGRSPEVTRCGRPVRVEVPFHHILGLGEAEPAVRVYAGNGSPCQLAGEPVDDLNAGCADGSGGGTAPYINVGKSPLIRMADKNRFRTLEDIDRADVKIGVNPGGTNEKFVRANIRHARIVVIEKNLDIPDELAAGNVDVMITDNVEAMLVAGKNPKLYAVDPENTYTRDDFGYMLPRDDHALLNWMNLWMHQMHRKGEFEKLKAKWIGN